MADSNITLGDHTHQQQAGAITATETTGPLTHGHCFPLMLVVKSIQSSIKIN